MQHENILEAARGFFSRRVGRWEWLPLSVCQFLVPYFCVTQPATMKTHNVYVTSVRFHSWRSWYSDTVESQVIASERDYDWTTVARRKTISVVGALSQESN